MTTFLHRLDRRADRLAAMITKMTNAIAEMLNPRGGHAPFTHQLTTTEAAKFWQAHRYDRIGAQIMQSMTPIQVAELDAWLARVTADQARPEGAL